MHLVSKHVECFQIKIKYRNGITDIILTVAKFWSKNSLIFNAAKVLPTLTILLIA
jgi:hypothetical protein